MTSSSASPTASFADFGVRSALVDALAANGITAPMPIQAATLTDVIAGRDVLARGRTGSGKTLAFSVPMVERLAAGGGTRRPGQPIGLILAPTRELATQIATALEPMVRACGLRVTTVFGGVPQNRQAKALKAGVDIVVACPGRLEDLMKQRLVALDSVRITVLDEADHMADLGFLPGVTRILAATPADGQRLLFSATLDNGVDKLVKRFMRNPLSHSVDEAHSPVPDMTHHVFEVKGADAKRDLVYTLASGEGRRILFMRTKHHARRLAKQLTAAGIPSTDLHGNLSQAARDRNLAAFAAGTARVLVATDVAARGVHVDDVELVVHVDPPAEHKAYLHRSGRTARAGSSGDVVTVVLPEQRKDVAFLLRKAGIDTKPQQVTANSSQVTVLVGAVAPLVMPRPDAPRVDDRDDQPARRGGARRGSQSRMAKARAGGNARGAGEYASRGDGEYGARGNGDSRDGGARRNGNSRNATADTRTSDNRGASGTRTRGAGAPSTRGAHADRRATAGPAPRTGSTARRAAAPDRAPATGNGRPARTEDRATAANGAPARRRASRPQASATRDQSSHSGRR
ncbi:DEAD/DEAH box helicase [Nocardia sp. NBC_01503]|uniref:DEAD/DEAH box helicase n=1 Tax=Nocardia sp. NBC_01503 TaxID=2975997 RepID=UPI002E7B52D2|nr:DEAD/DEAH box helicase [Nocardia sp. NBC_01503]WTL29341.1 DEAD/DEAH box helicase [Nocardia sp. NBC_01503]